MDVFMGTFFRAAFFKLLLVSSLMCVREGESEFHLRTIRHFYFRELTFKIRCSEKLIAANILLRIQKNSSVSSDISLHDSMKIFDRCPRCVIRV